MQSLRNAYSYTCPYGFVYGMTRERQSTGIRLWEQSLHSPRRSLRIPGRIRKTPPGTDRYSHWPWTCIDNNMREVSYHALSRSHPGILKLGGILFIRIFMANTSYDFAMVSLATLTGKYFSSARICLGRWTVRRKPGPVLSLLRSSQP